MISYFTPFHKPDTKFLERCYQSLLKQTNSNWEWVIVRNGDGIDADLSFCQNNAQVKIFYHSNKGNIGGLKKFAVSKCLGEVVGELDYDDWLREDCTEKLIEAFADGTADFVYSDCYEVKNEKTFMPYSPYYGWRYRTEPDGKIVTVSKEPSPASFSWIYFCANHIRSFRKSFYDRIGGHDSTLEVADDFDLCCRSYIHGNVVRIPEALYYYVHHDQNTSGQLASDNRNAKIQELTRILHDKYISDICLKWCKLTGLKAIDLGARYNSPKGYISADLHSAELNFDLQKEWPIEDSTIGVLRCHHVLEHLDDVVHFMNESYRTLAPGAFLLVEVPEEKGIGAWSDPTHKRAFNTRSFKYFTHEDLAQFIRPNYKGRFQLNRIAQWNWGGADPVEVVTAHMICLKPPYDENWCGGKDI